VAYQIQISAKLLKWPKLCACCCEPADDVLRISASHTTGKRVQNTKTYWWDVPYCKHCLNHLNYVNKPVSSGPLFSSVPILVRYGLFAGMFVWFMATPILQNIVAGFFVGLLVFIASFIPGHKTREAHQKAIRDDHLSMMKTSCCSLNRAIHYIDWYGTTHTFVFANKSYLDSFLIANAGKNRSDVKQLPDI